MIVQSEHLDAVCGAWLGERADLCVVAFDDPAFEESLAEAEGLLVRTYTQVNASLLERAPKLRCVGRAGVAVENIDIGACRARGVEVVHTPGANTQSVVELMLAFMLDAFRPRVFLEEPLASERWRSLRKELIAPRQLRDLTLGIVGFGRVGSRVAELARVLGMQVVFTELREIPAHERFGAEPVDLDALLAGCDVVSVHVDDRPSNRRMFSGSQFARMQDDALLINTSRGFVIDPLALAAWLRDHPAAQAILDVHEPEPIEAGDPLLALPNARLSPHIGAATATAHRNMSWVVRDLWGVLCGEPAVHPAPDRA